MNGIIWKFDIVKDGEETLIITGFREYAEPFGLKDGVSESFGNPTECAALIGGISCHFVSCLATKLKKIFP